MIDETHSPAKKSWVSGADAHPDFPIQNLPIGVFSPPAGAPRGGVAIGDHILDLAKALAAGLISGKAAEAAAKAELNDYLALDGNERAALRKHVSDLLDGSTDAGKDASSQPSLLHAANKCTMHVPARIGDYTDFYTGIHHATNVGKLFRPDNPLLPNYKYVPIGYHGRSSSIDVAGPVKRPTGQRKPATQDAPDVGPCRSLDFELELGIWLGGKGNSRGETIPIARARENIAGLCLLNDWSARDLQAWEYVPLGPFLAKNFATTISPWIITAEALEPYRISQPARPEGDPKPFDYLWNEEDQKSGSFNVEVYMYLTTEKMRAAGAAPHRLGRSAMKHMYWTCAQLVTHHASGGCNLSAGDLLGTGTISTPDDSGLGSLLEASRGGAVAIELSNGETRKFLEDGDEIVFRAYCTAPGRPTIGFGECRGQITG